VISATTSSRAKVGGPTGVSRLIPVVRRVPADTETPVSTYLKLARGPWSFLFESVEGGTRWSRYSLIGFDPFLTVEIEDNRAVIRTAAGEELSDDPIAAIRRILDEYRMPRFPELARLTGGLAGYLGYGAARLFASQLFDSPTTAEPRANGTAPRGHSGRDDDAPRDDRDPFGLPDVCLFAPRKILAFDNVRKTLDLMVLIENTDAERHSVAEDRAQAEIDDMLVRLRRPLPEETVAPQPCRAPLIEPLVGREEFERMVLEARDSVRSGEAIQVVVSQPFEGESGVDPFTAYRALRALDPTPYLFYLSLGETALVGASPEVMLRVERGRALLRPIAGTRPRGVDEAEDKTLEADLLADAKERAEHVMLVDLGRNDLGRVGAPGTVQVEESFAIERYSHVMHMVSTVSAVLRDDLDGLDALMAAFPAGTVSGAPKVRAMELISQLEGRPRGVYGGAVGYLGFDGDLDTCIAIRMMVFSGGRVRLQAGAGVVADSDPGREYEETLHKARALRRALDLAAAGLVPAAETSLVLEVTPCCS
jgi:anthranilate synthase component I